MYLIGSYPMWLPLSECKAKGYLFIFGRVGSTGGWFKMVTILFLPTTVIDNLLQALATTLCWPWL